ncbi:hypothetical protein Tco_0857939 [Tanacetum coccineum]|uniref:Uncharacterized protein n=1 Tax=Tanacetum coccineum TaxID=301880 RepID=A0ABQ5BAE5_9ASTR
MNENPKSLDSSMINYYLKVFQEYTRHDIKSIKNMLIRYLNAIKKEIDARARQEEEFSPGDNSDANKEKQAKEKCIVQFRLLYIHLNFLSGINSENTCSSGGFQQAFGLFFGEEVKYFAPRMLFNLDKLEQQLNNEEFDEEKGTIERGLYKRTHDRKVNEQTIQTQKGMVNMVKDNCDVGLVVTERNGTKIENQDERTLGRHLEELGLNFERNQTRWEIGMKTQLMIEDQEWNPSGFIMTPS